MAKKKKTGFFCKECGYETVRWMGKCPNCGEWNTLVEAPDTTPEKGSPRGGMIGAENVDPILLNEVEADTTERLSAGDSEVDRVLGGGFVPGSLVLLGGDPGIGKSTILLQIVGRLASECGVLYISGEESAAQIKLRADRLQVPAGKIRLLTTTNIEKIINAVEKEKPDLVVVDSIQTMYTDSVTSAPGSVTQVRESTAQLLRLSKGTGTTIVLVGHVTKDGNIAGPRMLEHMVDVVLYFEGEHLQQYRLLRGVKNRFGATDEIGLFEMTSAGLKPVPDASAAMLAGRPIDVPGTVVSAINEGTRSILVEIQALMNPSPYSQPVRMTQGFDRMRLSLLLAVLEKNVGQDCSGFDAYINVAGGMKIRETSTDLAVLAAVMSSIRNKPLPEDILVLGEVGMAGELRAVNKAERHIVEATRLGWKRFLLPAADKTALEALTLPPDTELYFVSLLSEAMDLLFSS